MFSDKDLEALKKFVENGNVLVISAYYLDDKLEKWLKVKIAPENIFSRAKDSTRIMNMGTAEYETFFVGNSYNTIITQYDTAAASLQFIGRTGADSINSISFKKGDGFVVIHTQPYMFSNYHLIKKGSKAYAEIFFSSLPGPLNEIIWDESVKSSDRGELEPLRFILAQPPLRNAFLWALAGLILLVLFSLKRKQRVIPFVAPITNNTLDMVRTVTDMYYFSRKNKVIAKKKIAHWLEFLRTKYNLFTSHSPDTFWQSFQVQSGMSEENAKQLREMVERYRDGEEPVSDDELIKLNKLIDSSYKF
jgi:hypothetical protein